MKEELNKSLGLLQNVTTWYDLVKFRRKMDWIQFSIFFITFVGLFIWNRTESRSDMRHMDAKLESNRNLSMTIHQESLKQIQAIKEDSRNFQVLWLQESKDFHGRLCAIEERNKVK